MNIDEIEQKIACNELNAAQVFTQMKQYIQKETEKKQAEKLTKTAIKSELTENSETERLERLIDSTEAEIDDLYSRIYTAEEELKKYNKELYELD